MRVFVYFPTPGSSRRCRDLETAVRGWAPQAQLVTNADQSAAEAFSAFAVEDRTAAFDMVLVDGAAAGAEFSRMAKAEKRLWVHLSDIENLIKSGQRATTSVRQVATHAHRLIVDSESDRSLIEAFSWDACAKTAVLPELDTDPSTVAQWWSHTAGWPKAEPDGEVSATVQKRLLIGTHNAKFLGELVGELSQDPSLLIDWDRWVSLAIHNPWASRRRLRRSDVVLCEWGGPNLVWYSNHAHPEQRIVCRIHGSELRSGTWFHRVRFERVDRIVCVSEHYRDMAIRKLGVEPTKVVVIPNLVDSADFRRPKLPGAEFTLGMMGYVPFLKRPDRALDLLEHLLSVDRRYRLDFKGRPPWEYPAVWNDPVEKASYLDFFARIRESPELAAAVRFTPFSPDVAAWFRNIGFILSPSDHESFHLSACEGTASGSTPIVWRRVGAETLFPSENIIDDAAQAAALVMAAAATKQPGAPAVELLQVVEPEQVIPLWRQVLFGDDL